MMKRMIALAVLRPSNPIKLHQIYFLMVFDGLWWQMFSIKAVKSRQTSSNIFFDGFWWFLMAFGGRCFPSKPSNPVKLHQICFLMEFGGF